MDISAINLVYFSATRTTRKVMRLIAAGIGDGVTEYDITQPTLKNDVVMDSRDLLVVGMPVYAGRIPATTVDALNMFKGNGTPAIVVCVYGNRDYDDALLEMKDIVTANGFNVISAGAFVAQHSIFPAVGANRPDENDVELIKDFAGRSLEILHSVTDINELPEVVVKGNHPYKVPGKIPLQPKGNKQCNECGTCVKMCPVGAIPAGKPRKTNKEICISCARCIAVCPQNARHFGGLLYKMAGSKFVKANSERKEPEMVYASMPV